MEQPFKADSPLAGDHPRQPRRGLRRFRLPLAVVAILAATLALTWAFRTLAQAVPLVEQQTLWLGVVKQGELLREVRAMGALVPEAIEWISAPGEGRVREVHVKAGQEVAPGDLIISLSNPVLEQEKTDAEWQLHAAEAALQNLRAEMDTQLIAEQSNLKNLEADRQVATLQQDRDRRLAAAGLLADYEVKVSDAKAIALNARATLAGEALAKTRQSIAARLAVQEATLEQARARLALRASQFAALTVVADTPGVLQQVLVERGQQVQTATPLAKLAQAGGLKAELRVPEVQASEIAPGQAVRIDTRNGIVTGSVARIDPAVRDAAVLVEVALPEELPRGARPDLSVEGIIELARIPSTLHVTRPANINPGATARLFKVDPATRTLIRVPVQFGAMSATDIQVTAGLAEGDQIVLSEMTKWDQHDHLRLR